MPDYQVKPQMDNVIFTRREGSAGGLSIPLHTPPSPALASFTGASDQAAGEVTIDAALASFGAALEQSKRQVTIGWQAMEQVSQSAPGWDKYFLERTYCEWAADKAAAINEDARFIAWVKSFTKGKPP